MVNILLRNVIIKVIINGLMIRALSYQIVMKRSTVYFWNNIRPIIYSLIIIDYSLNILDVRGLGGIYSEREARIDGE